MGIKGPPKVSVKLLADTQNSPQFLRQGSSRNLLFFCLLRMADGRRLTKVGGGDGTS